MIMEIFVYLLSDKSVLLVHIFITKYLTRMQHKKLINIILIVFLTFLVSSAVGLLFYGMMVFDPDRSTFGLISYGLAGSVIFAAFYFANVRIGLLTTVILFLAYVMLNYEAFTNTPVTSSLYFASAAIAVFIHSEYVFKRMTIDKFIRPLLLSGSFTILFGVSAIITLLLYAVGSKLLLFIPQAGLGTVIGLCIGVSIEFAGTLTEKIAKK